MAWPAIDGKAFAIRLQTPDGDLDLELNDTTLKQLLQALLQSSAACAPKRTDLQPITKSELADGVQLPASGIDAQPLHPGAQLLRQPLGDPLGDENARPGATDLPLVEPDGVDHAFHH